MSVWLPDGTSLNLSVDTPVTGPGSTQFIFQNFSPAPPATLTAPFSTTAVYLSLLQIISNALGSGGIFGPGANGIAQLADSEVHEHPGQDRSRQPERGA